MTVRTFHLIPHVHWDREWYLSRSVFTARLVPVMDRILELLESAPRLRFHLDGQMILVEDYLQMVPGARGTIEALVRRGQLAVGPWYVLADELIPSGISLTRNLDIGLRMAREFGAEHPVLYSPDAFGHPAGLPDLAQRFGIPWGVLWRGLGRPGGVERDLHRWRGPDGGSILLHHLPPQGYEAGADLLGASGLPARWMALRDQLVARATTTEIAIPVGADHHMPPADLPELAARIGALQPDAVVRFSSWAEYFTAVERTGFVPATIHGELRDSAGYVWSLPGVHGTRSRMKRHHARAEALVITASGIDSGPVVDRLWRELIQGQFHDTIAGCTADAVAQEQEVRLAGITAVAEDLIRTAVHRAAGHDANRARESEVPEPPVLAIWNPGRQDRAGVVIAETTWFDRDELVGPPGGREPREGIGYRAFHLRAPDGSAVPVQVLRLAPGLERVDASEHYPGLDRVDRVWIAAWVPDLPAGRTVVLRAEEGAGPSVDAAHAVTAGGDRVGNGLVEIRAERDATFSLRYPDGAPWTRMFRVESEPDRGDLYTPDPEPRECHRARGTGSRIIAAGPLVGGLETSWTVSPATGGLVRGRTVVWLEAGDAGVRVRVEFDNHAVDHRLRVVLPGVLAGSVRVGAPFGAALRGPGRLDRSWDDEAMLPTAPGQGFLESTDPARPFRLDWPGSFEYEYQPDGGLAITLARSVGQLSRADGRNRRGHAGWAMATPGGQEPGRHVIELRVSQGNAAAASVIPVWIRSPSIR